VYNHIEPNFPTKMKEPLGISPLRAALMYSLFSGKIYRMAAAFSEELAKVRITVKAACIPADNEIVCIELPPGYSHQCVYIGTTENPGTDSNGPVYKRIELHFSDPLKDSSSEDRWDRMLLHFYSEDEVIDDAINAVQTKSGKTIPVSVELLKFAINCYLYIHSGKPDLRNWNPPKRPLTRKPKVLRKFDRDMEDKSMLPVVLVGYAFMKSTEVAAHFQGYWTGVGRTTLELRFKEPYVKGGEATP